jgi:Asp-tRNA(Asn)/Glu-tRNA(Gln) amidotransferase C subunit
MNALLSAIAVTACEVERMRRELEVVEQRLRVLRRAAGLPVAPTPAAEPSAPMARLRADDASDWLLAALSGGPMPAAQVRQRGAAVGLAWRTLQRAGRLLGVRMKRCGFSTTAGSVWSLPQGGARD